MQNQIKLDELSDIELMVLIKQSNEEFQRIENNLKILNLEYNRRCELFIEKNNQKPNTYDEMGHSESPDPEE